MSAPLADARQFRPPALLRNPHVQSVLASSRLRRLVGARHGELLRRNSVEHILDCGDGVRLQGFHTAQQARATARALVVLLHGWEGNASSSYLLQTSARLLGEGFDVFRLHLRDHGDTHHLNEEIFHSCRIAEVVGAVRELARSFPDLPLCIAGYSLGGNFALRVALHAPAAGVELRHAVAVCPAISPPSVLHAIENAPWFYQRYFMQKWAGSLRRKQALYPRRYEFDERDLRSSLRQLTRAMVERHTDFGTLENYLDGYSIAGERLAALRVPASILTSADDPIIPVDDFRQLTLPAHARLDIAPYGGHCGFIRDYGLSSYAEDYVVMRLVDALSAPATATAASAGPAEAAT